jgi:pullulanase
MNTEQSQICSSCISKEPFDGSNGRTWILSLLEYDRGRPNPERCIIKKQGDSCIFSLITSTLMVKQSSVVNAYLENDTTILLKLADPLTLPFEVSDITLTDATTGKTVPVINVALPQAFTANPPEDVQQLLGVPGEQRSSVLAGVETNLVEVVLAEAPDVTHSLHIALPGYMSGPVTPRNILNGEKYLYHGDDLGNSYQPEATSFRLWAPTASDVQVLLYETEIGPLQREIAMQRGENGTWYAQVSGDWQNWYYLYQVTVHGMTQNSVDPYVKAIAVNATRGMIVHLPQTNPPGWREDRYVALAHPQDAIIYEVHVRDFSINPNSGMANRGKYLAFTEHGTTGILSGGQVTNNVATGVDHLKELGITHVQLQPVQEFASVDEQDPDQYNWGYDPGNFNVPEGAYATTPHGTVRVTECKQMVQSLHQEGIGVILDVVYNHTFSWYYSDFDKIVPEYYYRTDDAGNYTNGSGTGNEIAAERPMVQKFILDSLAYWVREYHVDGFRFDLMALLGIETMKKVYETLHAINPHILLYGEPWAGGTSGLPANQLLTKGQQKGLGLAVFNDHIRNALCGSVFDRSGRGFATGARGLVDEIKRAVEGSINDFAASPGETINYVTSHDNYTLWDKIALSNPDDTEADRIKMDELAQAVILTSQGIAFLQGGEEMLRTKGGNDNSYNAGDAVNQFDWLRKAHYWKVWRYYAGLIHLRKYHPAFRMQLASDVQAHLSLLAGPEDTVMFELSGHANGDSWENILVIYNPTKVDLPCTLPSGDWTIVVSEDRISEDYLGRASGRVVVHAISCMVLYQG